jgi:DNA (cytosine-5)-methyltransferase 1
LNNETLVNNAAFIVAQVTSYEDAGDEDEDRFMVDAPCMRNLIQLTGIEKKAKKPVTIRGQKKSKAMAFSMATATLLILEVFEECFKGQIETSDEATKGKAKPIRKKRCGVCEDCVAKECGECVHCLNMIKFGGNGKSKQTCVKQSCSNKIDQDEDVSASEDEMSDLDQDQFEEKNKENNKKASNRAKKEAALLKGLTGIKDFTIKLERMALPNSGDFVKTHFRFSWPKAAMGEIKGSKVLYDEVKVGHADQIWTIGHHTDRKIGQISYFFEKRGNFYAHLKNFIKGSKTLLGETADPHELFEIHECEDVELSSINSLAIVKFWPLPQNWGNLGATKESLEVPPFDIDNFKEFYYRYRYQEECARYEHASLVSKALDLDNPCTTCQVNDDENMDENVNLF